MSEETCNIESRVSESPSLVGRIESILFGVNGVLTVLATILIFRQQRNLMELLSGFGVEMPSMTEFALSPAVLVLLPGLAILATISHFLKMCPKRKLAIQIIDFVAILAVTILFLAATLPVTMKLIEQLE